MTTEFKDALEVFDNGFTSQGSFIDFEPTRLFEFTKEQQEKIRRALRIADRLMQDPTHEMICAGFDCDYNEEPEDIFIAMRDQLLKEINDV